MTSKTACPSLQRKENKFATTHVAKVDTVLSPKLGVTQEGHCRLGTDPTPRTDQPKGTEVGHAGLSVGFSKVIPERFISKTEYTNTQ
jgi:hypothetical protein